MSSITGHLKGKCRRPPERFPPVSQHQRLKPLQKKSARPHLLSSWLPCGISGYSSNPLDRELTFPLTWSMREIRFYRTARGESPIGTQTSAESDVGLARGPGFGNRAAAVLEKVGRHGRDLGSPRRFGGNAFRLLAFWDVGGALVLTKGFAKKSQKTPANEIALSEQRRKDYLSRRKEV